MNVSLGAEEASFRCLVIGLYVNWLQNEDSISYGLGQKFDVSNVRIKGSNPHLWMSTLTVNMSLIENRDNNTKFTCVVSFGGFPDKSSPALFLTQGMNCYWSSTCTCIQVHFGVCVCCIGF